MSEWNGSRFFAKSGRIDDLLLSIYNTKKGTKLTQKCGYYTFTLFSSGNIYLFRFFPKKKKKHFRFKLISFEWNYRDKWISYKKESQVSLCEAVSVKPVCENFFLFMRYVTKKFLVSYCYDWRQFRVALEYSGKHKKLLENTNSVFS